MILSILICSLPESSHYLNQILGYLGPAPEGVEILIDNRDRQIPTGTKRNDLIQRAQGEYFSFVDCDDKVEPDYIPLILKALEDKPDCVPIDGTYIDLRGTDRMFWTMRIGEKYEARGNHIYRWPNHLAVMKKSLVQHIKFPSIWKGEDYAWSKQIADQGLLKTQVLIPKRLYTYLYISDK